MQMSGRSVAIWAAVAIALGIVTVLLVVRSRHASVTFTGVVLRQDLDPRKQLPIPNVKVTATEGERSAEGLSDTSGLFRLKPPNGGWREQPVSRSFRHPDYQPVEIAPAPEG